MDSVSEKIGRWSLVIRRWRQLPAKNDQLAELQQVLQPEIAALAAPRIEEQLLSTMREAVATIARIRL